MTPTIREEQETTINNGQQNGLRITIEKRVRRQSVRRYARLLCEIVIRINTDKRFYVYSKDFEMIKCWKASTVAPLLSISCRERKEKSEREAGKTKLTNERNNKNK